MDDVLVLCTGNICRSPMAEAILRHRLQAAGVDARVHSAGLLQDGNPASRHGVDILGSRGIDLTQHSSRRMTAAMIRDADLVLGMAREHVREAVVLEMSSFPKAFTLKELVRRAENAGGRRPGQSLQEWLARLHTGRTPEELMSRSTSDDVADPVGQGPDVYRRTADELDGLLGRLVGLAWGAVAPVGRD